MIEQLSLKVVRNYIWNYFAILFRCYDSIKPLFFTVYTNMRCNFHCSYCSFALSGATKSHRRDELNTEEMLKLLEIIRKEVAQVYFTGGEPLLRTDIIDILRACKKMGFKSVSVNTNMSLIHRKMEVLDHVTNLVASLDMVDGDGGVYSKVLGVDKKIVSRVMQNIITCAKLQKEKGFIMTVNCVVTPDSISSAREVMQPCSDHGIRFSIVPAENHDGSINMGLKNSAEYQRLIGDIIKIKKVSSFIFGSLEYLKTISSFKRFRCFPTLTPHVYPNGDLFYPCEPLQKVSANLLREGSYKKALAIGRDKHGSLPMCKDRCYKSCYVETSRLSESPKLLFEL